MATRRELAFADFAAVLADVDRLRERGYERAGNWDLAQVCGHLTNWLSYPLDGFPPAPLPIRVLLGLLRVTMGRRKFLQYLAEGMPAGKPTMPQSVPAPGGDETAAVAAFQRAVERFRDHTGPVLPSPLFGAMTLDEAQRLQLCHCAHHLSFLVPKTN